MINNYNNSRNYPINLEESEDYIENNKEQNITTGKFISFEGGEGCGKSTQSKMLYDALTAKNIDVLLTREVGGTKEAEKIRDILLYSDLLGMSEVMLVMAARFEHLNRLIIPALKSGVWVICDRFVDSTAAYQGKNSDIGIDKIYELHNEFIGAIMPDMTFFIDLTPAAALERAKNRGSNNKFEDKDLAFHDSVYEGFSQISKKFKNRIVRVEAQDLSKDEIHANIMKELRVLDENI